MGRGRDLTDEELEAIVERWTGPRPPPPKRGGSGGRGAIMELIALACLKDDPFADPVEKAKERRRAAEAAHPPSPVRIIMKDGVYVDPPPPPSEVPKDAVARAAAWMRKKIAEGCCRRCGKPRGEDGTEVYCRPCAVHATVKMKDRRRSWTQEERARANEVNRARRKRLIAEGKCRKCGKPRDTGLEALCGACSEKARESLRARKARKRAARGLLVVHRDDGGGPDSLVRRVPHLGGQAPASV